MDWIASISDIIKAQKNNQLVIFVGAGVSKNSNIPTWKELIREIAKSIQYDEKCTNCAQRTDICPKTDCIGRYDYTQDEMLRIPEYFYLNDRTESHSEYFNQIKTTLKCDGISNLIDDEIFRILPHHIITTNYDPLLENSTDVNAQLYAVVTQDKDLLSKASERYLIKMHGDLEIPQTIVLKETDYLNYEQDHPLISTFIRSLLINHTFMFLGYSLNDYNLNLIIEWINYFSKLHSAERLNNYLITVTPPTNFEVARLESKKINVIDISAIDSSAVPLQGSTDSINNPFGQCLLSYLRCISDSRYSEKFRPLFEVLSEKYQVLKSYKKISYNDLKEVHPFKSEFISTKFVFYDRDQFDGIRNLVINNDDLIINTLQRAGITAIVLFDDTEKQLIPALEDWASPDFQLYLDNDYIGLQENTLTNSNAAKRLFYGHLLGESNEAIETLITEDAFETTRGDYIALILHKMRSRVASISEFDKQGNRTKELSQLFETVPHVYRASIGFLRTLFESTDEDMHSMEEILAKQENRYSIEPGKQTWHSGHSFIEIWRLQSFAYNYYYFIKFNYLPFDYFSDSQTYLAPYIKAILCSYSPVDRTSESYGSLFDTDRRSYPLNEIDLDIFVKFIGPESLKRWIKKYHVQKLIISPEVNITEKFANLCASFSQIMHRKWLDQLFCFSIIICLTDMDNDRKKIVYTSMVNMIDQLSLENSSVIEKLFGMVVHLSMYLNVDDDSNKSKLFDILLSKDVFSELADLHSHEFFKLIKVLKPFCKNETINRVVLEINDMADAKMKYNHIFLLRFILPMELYKELLSNHINEIGSRQVFELLVEKILPFTSETRDKLVETVVKEDKKRKETPGLRTFPDHLLGTIEYCILLKLLGFDFDLSLLSAFAHYSGHLQFILDPQEFDYSKVDINNYMWQNLIYTPEYKKYFLDYKDDILSAELENVFSLGNASTDQQKIVYGILLDEDKLREYGK